MNRLIINQLVNVLLVIDKTYTTPLEGQKL